MDPSSVTGLNSGFGGSSSSSSFSSLFAGLSSLSCDFTAPDPNVNGLPLENYKLSNEKSAIYHYNLKIKLNIIFLNIRSKTKTSCSCCTTRRILSKTESCSRTYTCLWKSQA